MSHVSLSFPHLDGSLMGWSVAAVLFFVCVVLLALVLTGWAR